MSEQPHDNHYLDLHKCPCGKKAINKGIVDGDHPVTKQYGKYRLIFCIDCKQQWVPIDQHSKAIDKLKSEEDFFKQDPRLHRIFLYHQSQIESGNAEPKTV